MSRLMQAIDRRKHLSTQKTDRLTRKIDFMFRKNHASNQMLFFIFLRFFCLHMLFHDDDVENRVNFFLHSRLFLLSSFFFRLIHSIVLRSVFFVFESRKNEKENDEECFTRFDRRRDCEYD